MGRNDQRCNLQLAVGLHTAHGGRRDVTGRDLAGVPAESVDHIQGPVPESTYACRTQEHPADVATRRTSVNCRRRPHPRVETARPRHHFGHWLVRSRLSSRPHLALHERFQFLWRAGRWKRRRLVHRWAERAGTVRKRHQAPSMRRMNSTDSSATKSAPSHCSTVSRWSSSGIMNSRRSAMMCGLISATVMLQSGSCR